LNYKQAHNDLVNLFPAVGQINADRSNKPFVDVAKTKVKSYGKCDVQIGSRGIVPPKKKQGDIARVAFYMSEKYGVTYSKRQLELFKQWNNQDPISQQERAHNKRVIKAQGFGLVQ
jgi:deoxyribonuclease-1